MKTSGFEPNSLPAFPAWKRYLSYLPLYGIGVPLTRALGLVGKWPHAMARQAWRTAAWSHRRNWTPPTSVLCVMVSESSFSTTG